MNTNEITIELSGLSATQIHIADWLWAAETPEDLDIVRSVWGRDQVQIVETMMIAAMIDCEVQDDPHLGLAGEALRSIGLL